MRSDGRARDPVIHGGPVQTLHFTLTEKASNTVRVHSLGVHYNMRVSWHVSITTYFNGITVAAQEDEHRNRCAGWPDGRAQKRLYSGCSWQPQWTEYASDFQPQRARKWSRLSRCNSWKKAAICWAGQFCGSTKILWWGQGSGGGSQKSSPLASFSV